MSVFADSSAIVKLYVPEEGHETVRRAPAPFVVSVLARVEVPAAFWGKHRTDALSAEDAALLTAAFTLDYHGDDETDSAFAVIALTADILQDAALQAARHGLRAYDAVQLATALAARAADPAIDTVTVLDQILRRAMLAEGFLALT